MRSGIAEWYAILAVLLVSGCQPDRRDARRIYVVDGLDQPESVQYDPRQDLFFVSSMAGYGSVKNGMGYIAQFAADAPERWEVFIRSGVAGARLDAPKGMTLQGDTLWVADIDVLRGFHRVTGTPLAQIDLAAHGAVLLNALTLAPDGTLYITDSGIVMSPKGVLYVGGDKIFAVAPDGRISVAAEGPELGHPNGITWDPEGRLLVASFAPFSSELYSVGSGGERAVVERGSGRFDGVKMLPDGRIAVTSWNDSSLYIITEGRQERVVRHLWQPADLGVDTRRNRVAIPLVLPGRVELWELPR